MHIVHDVCLFSRLAAIPPCTLFAAERCGSAAPGSRSAAEAVRRQLQPVVRQGVALYNALAQRLRTCLKL